MGVKLTGINILRRAIVACLSGGFAICQIPPVARNVVPGIAYVGSAACTACHRAIVESFRMTGMGRSMTLPHDGPFLEMVQEKERRVNSEKLSRTFDAFVRDGELYQSE